MYEIGFKNGSKILVEDNLFNEIDKHLESKNCNVRITIDSDLQLFILPSEIIYIQKTKEQKQDKEESEAIICPHCGIKFYSDLLPEY